MLTEVETINQPLDTGEGAMAVLCAIPTVFGRLVYLAAMWDASINGYRSDPRAVMTCSQAVNTALGRAHMDAFLQWLTLSLERQRGDLMSFADSDGPGAYECLRSWWSDGFFDHLAPATANRHENLLFRDNLILVIMSLVGESRE